MFIPSLKQKLFKLLFYKDVAIKAQFFNRFSCRVFPTGKDQRSPPSYSVHPPPISAGGGLNLQPNFQKGGLAGPQLLEGSC